VIIEETSEYIIARNGRGQLVKLCKGYATLPLPLEHPVKTMDDWLQIKPHYLFSEERFGEEWLERAQAAQAEGAAITVWIPGAFHEPRELMGDAALCLAYAERSEVIHDILETMGETAFRVLERISSQLQVDQLNVPEDLAGKDGPLIGPGVIKEFFRPYYRKSWDLLAARGTKLFFMDSDGNLGPIIPALLEAGLNILSPMEPTPGTDIVKLRETYGTQLAFWGGLDKHVLRGSKAEITVELEYKIPPMVRTGGCVLGLDHRIPNGTLLEHYRFYLQKVWEIMERERK
jgi:uroporphyrinogen-III decarboxylase